jgi:MscS family membrane protein
MKTKNASQAQSGQRRHGVENGKMGSGSCASMGKGAAPRKRGVRNGNAAGHYPIAEAALAGACKGFDNPGGGGSAATMRLSSPSFRLFWALLCCGVFGSGTGLCAQTDGGPGGAGRPRRRLNTTAAAAVASGQAQVPRTPDFLEHLVDATLELFDVKSSGNTVTHYVIAAFFLVGSYLLRRVVTTILFGFFKRLAAAPRRRSTTSSFPALEGPVAAFIAIVGAVAALKVLKFSEQADRSLRLRFSTVAFSLVLFWLFLRAFNTVLDHVHELARARQLGIAAFMPWIKKALVTVFVVFGVLMVAQSLGADVKAFLAGLGLGGLAFALAAQDTIANLFGSVVVAIDQPFKIGEAVQIGATIGVVEDIGLRSTKDPLLDKSLVIIPNKTVAAEAITNLSRFTQRRVAQTLGLTYDTTPEQMEGIVADIRGILKSEAEVEQGTFNVYFRDYSASSLDIWITFLTLAPDFAAAMQLRQKVNLAIMRAVQARGASFAFPTQTMHLDGPVAKALAGQK